jgi:transposase
MIRFVGIDVHKRIAELCFLDPGGKVLERQRIGCGAAELREFAERKLTKEDRVALEATTNTWAVVRLLQPFVQEVVVSNPLRTKAIAEARIKTDKVDAEVLGQLLRTDFLPRVWTPPEATCELRQVTSRRASLTADKTGIKNRIHAILHQRLLQPPVESLFGTKGRAWLAEVPLDPPGRAALDSELRLLALEEQEIQRLDDEVVRKVHADRDVRLLITLPGIDVTVAVTLLAALGDIQRFRSGAHAASYLGLVPRTKQSAEHCYHGRITKQGNAHARWVLVQAAQHVGKNPGPLGAFFRRLAKRKNRNVAVVATARKLVMIAYHMLLHREPYRYGSPHATEGKLARLRLRAGGARLRRGPAKGTPLPAAPKGRTRPSLGQVYAKEAVIFLPLDMAPAGELRMLDRLNLRPFAEGQQLTFANRVNARRSAEVQR